MANTSLARRVSWWSLLAMVFLVPIVMSDFTLPGLHDRLSFSTVQLVKLSLIISLALLALTAWAADLLRNGGVLRRAPVDWLVLAWLGWAGLTTLTAVHWPTALLGTYGRYEGLVTFAVYAVLYFLVLQFAGEENRTLRLAQVLFCSSLIVAVYGLLQHAGIVLIPADISWDEADRAFSTYGNPSMLGGFLVFPVVVSLGLALRERRTFLRLLYWAGFGLNAFALLATFTRSAWLGGFAGLILLGIIAWRKRAKMHLVDLAPAGAFGAVAITFVVRSLSSPHEVTNIARRLASIFDVSSGSGQTRTQIWQAAAQAIKERPWLGWGSDTFGLVFRRFKSIEYVSNAGSASTADNAHNYPLHLAAGLGIPGALVFFAIWIWAGVRSFKVVFGRASGVSCLLIGAFWAAAAGYLLHLLFGLSVPGTTFLLWISLAVVLAPTARAVTVQARRWGTLIAVIVALLAALAVAGQGVALAADRADVIASEDLPQTTLVVRTTAADQAVTLNPLVPRHRGTLALLRAEQMQSDAAAFALAQQRGEDTTAQMEVLTQSFSEAESAYLEAIDFTPRDYANYVNLATVYNLAGAAINTDYYQAAIDTVNRGLEIAPLATDLRERLAATYVATDRTDEAIETLEYCLQLDPADSSAALTLAKLYQERDMVEQAIAVLETVRARAPGQPLIDAAIRALEEGRTLP